MHVYAERLKQTTLDNRRRLNTSYALYSQQSNACMHDTPDLKSLNISGSSTLILTCMHPGLTCFERLGLWLPSPHSVCTTCSTSQARSRYRLPITPGDIIQLTHCQPQRRHGSGDLAPFKPAALVGEDVGVLPPPRAPLTGRSSRASSRMARSGGDGGDAGRRRTAGTCSSCCG